MSDFIVREDLKSLVGSDKKYTLVEALPKEYYEAEHLPGAINIPQDEVHQTAARLLPDKEEPVIVYCASSECRSSHVAAEALRELGYSRVYEYAEGKKGWKEAGLPLENGSGSRQ